MRSRAWKDAATWHKSGVNEIARPMGTTGRSGKNDPLCASRLPAPRPSAFNHFESRSFFAGYSRLPPATMAAGLLVTMQALRTIASSHGSQRDSVRNSGRINRISSNWHFAVANCICFYTLRATRPFPVETRALKFCGSGRLLCSLFLRLHAPGGGALTCNRIHRNGG